MSEASASTKWQLKKINFTVVGVLFVFVYLYFVAVFCVIVPWLSYSVPGVMNLGILSITAALSLYCYLFCVLLDPGSVPVDWQPDDEGQNLMQEVKKKNAAPRFCQKCQRHKPPRTHHCRVCQRCVLRMDHHCPWTNNCIGHANHKAFLLFLIYCNASLVHVVGLLVSHSLHTLQTSWQEGVVRVGPDSKPAELYADGVSSVWLWVSLQVVAFTGALPLAISLAMLLGWNVHLVLTNKTTIEYQEGVTARIHALSNGGEGYQHPYDVGVCNNLHEALGANGAAWPLPPCQGRAQGTAYPTIWDPPEDFGLGLG